MFRAPRLRRNEVLSAQCGVLSQRRRPLATFTTSDVGQQRTVTDTNATGVRKFYRVQIAKILNP